MTVRGVRHREKYGLEFCGERVSKCGRESNDEGIKSNELIGVD